MTQKGSSRLAFQYDYLGRRVEKRAYSGNTLTSKTLFVYDGFKCVEELDALDSNAVQKRHTWQPFDAGLDVLLATTDDTGTSYFLHDANKNVMQKTREEGTTEETYAYAPFGENMGTASANVGFSSEAFDAPTNLNYYNYRYYVPDIGRWNNRDPLTDISFLYSFPLSNLNIYGVIADIVDAFASLSTKQFIYYYTGIYIHKNGVSYIQNNGNLIDYLGLLPSVDSVTQYLEKCLRMPCVSARIECIKIFLEAWGANEKVQNLLSKELELQDSIQKLRRVSDSYLKIKQIDAHALKEITLKLVDAPKKLSSWEIFMEPKTGELFLKLVHGPQASDNYIIRTGEIIK